MYIEIWKIYINNVLKIVLQYNYSIFHILMFPMLQTIIDYKLANIKMDDIILNIQVTTNSLTHNNMTYLFAININIGFNKYMTINKASHYHTIKLIYKTKYVIIFIFIPIN
jgi:hypothetical protein